MKLSVSDETICYPIYVENLIKIKVVTGNILDCRLNMNEMLGNQYFLARNYLKAKSAYEAVLKEHPQNLTVRKRIVICYIECGEISQAFNVFYALVVDDIETIINTNPAADDCPCPELVKNYGTILPYEENSRDLKLMLAMLWLYCNPEKSLEFFKKLKTENPGERRFEEICNLVQKKLSVKHESHIHKI
ncbi:MAG: hypothetical protein Kow0098_26470 [Ignavibacteriaceae bacterium]